MPVEGEAAGARGKRPPLVLLIQPPIYDFAAFDFFLYPLGLLNLGEALLARGFDVELIDALDRFAPVSCSPGMKGATFRSDGCGHFPRAVVPPPPQLAGIPRRYQRFGQPREALEQRMARATPPAAVAVTCAMTYWYPGAVEVAELARGFWPETPVLLGGVYATLCPEHGRKELGAEWVHRGRDLGPLLDFLENRAGTPPLPERTNRGHHLVGERPSAAVQASFGCPNGCPYCAASLLCDAYRRRPVQEVLDEIEFLVLMKNRTRIAFYDDALLEGGGEEFSDLASGLVARGLHERASFHCPNALRASALTEAKARSLRAANFRTLRIGFETADPALQRALGSKASNEDLDAAVRNLRSAGFERRDLGAYILVGLPGQEAESVEESIRFVHAAGALSRLAEYAPVPGTPFFEKAKGISNLDLGEPLNHNKTLAPFRFSTFRLEDSRRLKDLSRKLNQDLLRCGSG